MHSHILVVDDEPNIIRSIRTVLEAKGYTTDFAPNGKKALEKIRENRPALVVSDVMMPEMGGFELRESIRRDPVFSDLPIVTLILKPPALTGDYVETLERYKTRLNINRDRWVTKPFNPHELAHIVERLLAIIEEQASEPKGTTP